MDIKLKIKDQEPEIYEKALKDLDKEFIETIQDMKKVDEKFKSLTKKDLDSDKYKWGDKNYWDQIESKSRFVFHLFRVLTMFIYLKEKKEMYIYWPDSYFPKDRAEISNLYETIKKINFDKNKKKLLRFISSDYLAFRPEFELIRPGGIKVRDSLSEDITREFIPIDSIISIFLIDMEEIWKTLKDFFNNQ